MKLNPSWIREQFPALRNDCVFLDNAAGAQVSSGVIEKVTEAMTHFQVNVGGAYRESQRAGQVKADVRALAARFVNAEDARNIAFGPNATTLISLLAAGMARMLEPGDEVIVTGLDHHANVDPWRRLAEGGVVLKTWEPEGEHQELKLSSLDALLSNRTRLLAMTAASNALGTLTDVAGAARRARGVGAWTMVDAVHSAPHAMPDVQGWGADMVVHSPYKVFGPHMGILYLSDEVLQRLPAFGLSFFSDATTASWEPGTQSHEAIAGLGGVYDYLDACCQRLGVSSDRDGWLRVFQEFKRLEDSMTARLLEGLESVGAEWYGLPGVEGRTSTLSINLPDRRAADVAAGLAERRIAVANGHYYAYDLVMKTLGLAERGGAVRISVLHYNNDADVDAVIGGLRALA